MKVRTRPTPPQITILHEYSKHRKTKKNNSKQFCHIVLHPFSHHFKTKHRPLAFITSLMLAILSIGVVQFVCAIVYAFMHKKGRWNQVKPQNNKPQQIFDKTLPPPNYSPEVLSPQPPQVLPAISQSSKTSLTPPNNSLNVIKTTSTPFPISPASIPADASSSDSSTTLSAPALQNHSVIFEEVIVNGLSAESHVETKVVQELANPSDVGAVPELIEKSDELDQLAAGLAEDKTREGKEKYLHCLILQQEQGCDNQRAIAMLSAEMAHSYWKGLNGFPESIEDTTRLVTLAESCPEGMFLQGMIASLGLMESPSKSGQQCLELAIDSDHECKLPLEDILVAKSLNPKLSATITKWLERSEEKGSLDAAACLIYDKFKKALDADDTQAAKAQFELLRSLTEKNSGIANLFTAQTLFRGAKTDKKTCLVISQDHIQAWDCIEKAIDLGVVEAKVAAAQRVIGKDNSRPKNKPVELLEQAKSRGNAHACFVLATIQTDQTIASALYEKGARWGSVDAIKYFAASFQPAKSHAEKVRAFEYLQILKNFSRYKTLGRITGQRDSSMFNAMKKNLSLANQAYALGINYWKGANGAPQSLSEARKYLKEAADAALPEALCALGIMILFGNGEPSESVVDGLKLIHGALEHFLLLPNDQITDAAAIILSTSLPALLRAPIENLIRGRSATPIIDDEVTAQDCFRSLNSSNKDAFIKAFERLSRKVYSRLQKPKNAKALLRFGQLHFIGAAFNGETILPIDRELGWNFLKKAFEQNEINDEVMIAAAERLLAGDESTVDTFKIDPKAILEEQTAKADRQAAYLLATQLEEGNTHFGIDADLSRALELYEKASAWGHMEATRKAASLYSSGPLTDIAKAKRYHRTLANLGEVASCAWLQQPLPPVDDPKLLELIEQMFEGDSVAFRELGFKYLKGIDGAPVWENIGREYLELAANFYDADAFFEIKRLELLDCEKPQTVLESIIEFANQGNAGAKRMAAVMLLDMHKEGCLNSQMMEFDYFKYAQEQLSAAENEDLEAKIALAKLSLKRAVHHLNQSIEKTKSKGKWLGLYEESLQQLEILAKQGQKDACFAMAWILLTMPPISEISPVDAARSYLETAISQKMARALVFKALNLEHLGFSNDSTVSIQLLQEALALDSAEAAYHLSAFIPEQRLELLQKAAKLGSFKARFELVKDSKNPKDFVPLIRLGHREAAKLYNQLSSEGR